MEQRNEQFPIYKKNNLDDEVPSLMIPTKKLNKPIQISPGLIKPV